LEFLTKMANGNGTGGITHSSKHMVRTVTFYQTYDSRTTRTHVKQLSGLQLYTQLDFNQREHPHGE
jgi:hypothetical protein